MATESLSQFHPAPRHRRLLSDATLEAPRSADEDEDDEEGVGRRPPQKKRPLRTHPLKLPSARGPPRRHGRPGPFPGQRLSPCASAGPEVAAREGGH